MNRFFALATLLCASLLTVRSQILVYRFTPLTETTYTYDSGRLNADGYVVELTMNILYSSAAEKEEIAAVGGKTLCPVSSWTNSLSTDYNRSAESYKIGNSSYYIITWNPKLPPTPSEPLTGRFINLSTRAMVADGGTLISGFVINDGSKRVLVRAIGPGLKQFNVPNTMGNPKLEVYRQATKIAENNDWGESTLNLDTVFAANLACGAFPLSATSLDAATVLTLGPGAYTVHIRDVSFKSGEVLMEVYLVP
jgi:hypothetical protein